VGKRSSFERVPRDFYPTPYEAVVPLLPHLLPGTRYCEPCVGDGALVSHLAQHGHECVCAFDIDPKLDGAFCMDAAVNWSDGDPDFYITNPPWERATLHPIIENLSRHLPTWLLFDADWMHTRQSAPFLPWLKAIVSVGRVKWIPDSKMTGKDNCAWYLFNQNADPLEVPAVFYGRAA
jgi:hypothetical protein